MNDEGSLFLRYAHLFLSETHHFTRGTKKSGTGEKKREKKRERKSEKGGDN